MKKNFLNKPNKHLVILKSALNLHDPRNVTLYVVLAASVIFVASILIRKSLYGATNADYDIFVSWYDYVHLHGLASFSTDFSNYNPPYTYFLYLITLLPIAKIIAIKGLMVVFDLVMAIGIYLVAKHFYPRKFLPVIAGIGSLLLPTVLSNGIFWGQFDQFYTAFILFSLYALLKNNSKLTWLFFGIAIAIKLQAIFFLPVLVLMSFKRINLWHSAYGIVSFIALTFLPVLAGRSVGSILHIYVAQTGLFNGNLTLNAPNIYQWVPNSAFHFLNSAGIYLAIVFIIAVFIFGILYKKYSDKDVILLSTIMLFVVPFLLPQMHERYFFSATILAFILAIVTRRFIAVAIVLQITTIFSYIPFLFGQEPPISFSILALVGLAVSVYLLHEYLSPTSSTEAT
jgi:Gpi18-like mannosyltransferase